MITIHYHYCVLVDSFKVGPQTFTGNSTQPQLIFVKTKDTEKVEALGCELLTRKRMLPFVATRNRLTD